MTSEMMIATRTRLITSPPRSACISVIARAVVVRKGKASGVSNNVSSGIDLSDLAKTPNQVKYAKHLTDQRVELVIGQGPAGSGKTMIACAYAVRALLNKDIKKIIITRPTVGLDESIGYLPGTLEDKLAPWLFPVFDCFKQYVPLGKLQSLLKDDTIEICPLAYIRGRTFHNSWIIADEVQNTTPNQMKTLLTRVGQNSKIVLTGDLQQCDMKQKNGLRDFIDKHNEHGKCILSAYPKDPIQMVTFEEADVMRSNIVKHILGIYNAEH
jgi:phosphate starvation-inducible PhoH-like protein